MSTTGSREEMMIEMMSVTLARTPLRHKRERLYEMANHRLAPAAVRDGINMLRSRFGDTEASEVRTCPCGQRNRVNLMSPHNNGIGPRCGRCRESL